VNEKFSVRGVSSKSDTLSDLESTDMDNDVNDDAGRESCSFKTGGAIKSGLVKVESKDNKTFLILSNKLGEIYLLAPEPNSLKPVLKFKISGSIIRTPEYANGVIYCTTREGFVYAIKTGLEEGSDAKQLRPEILWQNRMDKGILTEPIATGKILIIATLSGIYAFEAYYDQTTKAIGKQLWGYSINGIVSSPIIKSGIIYIGSEDRNLYALEYGGSKISTAWKYKANAVIRSKPFISLKGDYVLTASNDGSVYCLIRNSGKLRWIFIVKSPVYSGIVSAIVDNEELFYFGADNGRFYCINAFGKKIWEFKTNGKIRTEALIKGNAVYFGSEDNNFYALNTKSGKQIFKFSTDGNINSPPIILNDIIYFGSTDSFAYGLHI